MVDFIAETPQKPHHGANYPEKRWWILHIDEVS